MIFRNRLEPIITKNNSSAPSPDNITVTFEEAILLNFHVGRIDESPMGSPALLNILSKCIIEFLAVIFSM